MCVHYRGHAYHYGFQVTAQTESGQREFRILMTKHLEDRPYVYCGLCIENGLLVTTNKRKRSAALCRIIKNIITGTLLNEEAFAKRYGNIPYVPFKKPGEDMPSLKKQFAKRMKGAFSLERYVTTRQKLEPLWEKPGFYPEEDNVVPFKTVISLKVEKLIALWAYLGIFLHSAPILYDCKEMSLAFKRAQKIPCLIGSNIKYRRI
jgi:hypothetical protein